METTDKQQVEILINTLTKYGVTDAVVSPGSRSTPIVIAISRQKSIKSHVVLDERTAAFLALGISQQSGQAVALICTSGTAPLNYAPAIAEAYYQHIPLLVITADRPTDAVNQGQSQTINQQGIYTNYIKYACQLPQDIATATDKRYTIRQVNQAIISAVTHPKAPVHINVPLAEPLANVIEVESCDVDTIEYIATNKYLPNYAVARVASNISNSQRVMVLISMSNPDAELSAELQILSQLPQVTILTESISNIDVPEAINTIDQTLSVLTPEEQVTLAPQTVITYGGDIISKNIRKYIKDSNPQTHIHIKDGNELQDTFGVLTTQIDITPSTLFSQILPHIKPSTSTYKANWQEAANRAKDIKAKYIATAPWSDLKAFANIIPAIPKGVNLQLSSGTTIRYAQLFDNRAVSKTNSNRGVNGIEGALSTAIGAAIATPKTETLLITGDMSFQYDSNALSLQNIPNNLKVIVIKNGGGGIFRYLEGTSKLPELEEYYETVQDVDIEQRSKLYGFTYIQATTETQLIAALKTLFASPQKTILEVVTPRTQNADILRTYFKQK